jgi:predicted sulfurtransferase
MGTPMEPVTVAALYQFAPFADPASLRPPLLALCQEQGIKGTLLLAGEGINGTIAGRRRALPPCSITCARCPIARGWT